MPEGFHPPVEEYLEAMHELEEEAIPIIQARLAERLGHSAPSVSEMVRRLQNDGFVQIDGRVLRLTKSGRSRAESVVRRHRLAERLLTDVIGIEWHKSHLEACRWEHVISDEVEAKLVVLLNNPSTCPHGNPIPGTVQSRQKLHVLCDTVPGDHVRLERVTESVEIDSESLGYLADHGLRPGAKAEVTAKAPDGTMTLEVDGEPLALGASLAGRLYVAVE